MGNVNHSIVAASDNTFDVSVLKAEKPVLVDFWASWCGPCRLMAPIVNSLATQYGDRLKIVKMEVDPNPDSVARYQIEGVPAFRLIHKGELLAASEGAVTKQKLQEMLDEHLSVPV